MRNIFVISCTLILMLTQATCIGQRKIDIVDFKISDEKPKFYNAIYRSIDGYSLRSGYHVSENNGISWVSSIPDTRRIPNPPVYGRRVAVTSISDVDKGLYVTFFNALDNPNIPKNISEPAGALTEYYIRYRVSDDGGDSWLSDDPIIASGRYSEKHPLPSVSRGENAFYLGDRGSIPIKTSRGTIVLPAQQTVKPDQNNRKLNLRNLYNPNKGHTYTEVIMLRGVWDDKKIIWETVSTIKGDPERTVRGLIEPTIVELENRTLLAVMRGSNGSRDGLPSYKWASYSTDDGITWSTPVPWTYDDDTNFFSPSAMSVLYKHSSGRIYWIGNINEENSKGSHPRYPIVIGEVDNNSGALIKSSVIVIDDKKEADRDKHNFDLGHATILEDRKTNELIISYPRIYGNSKDRQWATVRVNID